MTTTPLDLLRETRLEQGLPDPAREQAAWRHAVVKGALLGAALLVGSIGITLVLLLRQQSLSAELDRLAAVEAEVSASEGRLVAARGQLKTLDRANGALVAGLVAARSGSALLRDLQRRVPEGVQISSLDVPPGSSSLLLQGSAADPLAFARINALQIALARSPLLDPASVRLRKAARGAGKDEAKPATAAPAGVSFELAARFRPRLAPAAELLLLRELGATGMALRLQLLQREGLLP